MEQNSPCKIYESQLRQLLASVVWTHKIQEKQSDICRDRHKKYEFWRIFLSALTASGIFSVIFIDEFWLKVASSIVSMASLFISIYYEKNDFKTTASKHKATALKLFKVRERIISVLTEIKCSNIDSVELKKKLDWFYEEYFAICDTANDASDEAVSKASEALKIKGDNTYSDEEIDSFLPLRLRKSGVKDEY